MRFIKFLRQPYPLTLNIRKTIAIASLLVFLILYLFEPFGINHIAPDRKLFILIGYGVVTALAMLTHHCLLLFLLPKYYCENHWTVGRHILSNVCMLMLVTAGNIVYGYFFNITWQHVNLSVLITALLITVAVGVFPIVLITVIQYNRLFAISLRQATRLNESLSLNEGNHQGLVDSTALKAETLSFIWGTGRDQIEVMHADLRYIEACGNYVNIHYLKEGVPTRKTWRATIKQMESETAAYPQIIKCHRAFLVNLDAVRKVSGNSQGYRLSLDGMEEEVPVSRAFTPAVKTRIEQRTS